METSALPYRQKEMGKKAWIVTWRKRIKKIKAENESVDDSSFKRESINACRFGYSTSSPPVKHLSLARIEKDGVDKERRSFIKGASVSLAALLLGIASAERFFTPKSRNSAVMSSYPKAILVDARGNPITLAQIPSATTSSASYPIMSFNYPLQDEPNILLRLHGIKIPGPGVIYDGRDSIIALSGICQHLGCTVPLLDYHPHGSIPFEAELIGYTGTNWPEYGLLFCKCHGSQYDPTKGKDNLYNSGPAPSPANHSLPVILLETDSNGFVYANGINPESAVIRGHLWQPDGEVHGSLVESENLSGGTELPFDSELNMYKTIVTSSSNGPWPEG